MFERQPSTTRQQQRAERATTRASAAEARRARRKARRHERAATLGDVGRRLRPALPIALVTGLAMYGQIGYAYDQVTPVTWLLPARLLLAVAVAVAVESMALTVQWHAHDALLHGHTLTAARHRRTSYLIAAGVGLINYSHFAGPGWTPTPAAVVFAGFSTSGPWLWGLHTRRAQRVQLSREGQPDTGGAVFRAERYRWFPIRTLLALRWSIDHSVTDPRQAWLGYNTERAARPRRRLRGSFATPKPPAGTSPPDVPAGPSVRATVGEWVARASVARENHAGDAVPPAIQPAGDDPGENREIPPTRHVALHLAPAPVATPPTGTPTPGDESGEPPPGRAGELIAAGAGRRKLSRELGVSEYEARRLLAASSTSTNIRTGAGT